MKEEVDYMVQNGVVESSGALHVFLYQRQMAHTDSAQTSGGLMVFLEQIPTLFSGWMTALTKSVMPST